MCCVPQLADALSNICQGELHTVEVGGRISPQANTHELYVGFMAAVYLWAGKVDVRS